MNDDDWLMRQFKGVSNMIGTILNLKVSQLDLGIVEDEEGNLIKGEIYLENLLKSERFFQEHRKYDQILKMQNKTQCWLQRRGMLSSPCLNVAAI